MSRYDFYPVPAIKELLEERCPEGVPTVPLRELLKHVQPGKYQVKSTAYDPSAPTPVLSPGKGFLLGYTTETDGIFDASSNNPTIIFDDFTTSFHWVDFPFKVKSSAMKMLVPRTDDFNLRYVYWAMQMIPYQPTQHQRQWIQTYSHFEVPLPHPDVQEQIVAILDMFTDLTASLKRELDLRNDQFMHALDVVFSDSAGPRSALDKVGDFSKGKGITKAQLQEEGLPAFHYGQVHTSYGHSTTTTISYVNPGLIKNPTLAHPGDIILATTSEDDEAVGKAVAWLGNEDAVVGGDAYVYSHDLEPRYVSYFFASHDFQLQKASKIYGTKVRRINDKGLGALTIPVPAPETQERIANTLHMFTDYTANLRRELHLRRQQLECYRDQLLTFSVAD